ncbi:MAG: lysophospholipid acyltransferase family protein [Anaerolineaceae bacterium]|nr:lysophospholipid acyltransferase family protein [Anaerolineaceae bacterium]
MSQAYVRPPQVNPFLTWLSRRILHALGWKVLGPLPPYPKLVVVGVPHTSNWDGVVMVLAAWSERVQPKWMGKHTLFKPPFGWLMRRIGGVSIDRRAKHNAVEQAVQAFAREQEMVLVIAPEATRKKMAGWRTGFYYIALGAGVPLALAAMDYDRKEVRINQVLHPSGDLEADIAQMREYFENTQGLRPENQGPIVLLPRP